MRMDWLIDQAPFVRVGVASPAVDLIAGKRSVQTTQSVGSRTYAGNSMFAGRTDWMDAPLYEPCPVGVNGLSQQTGAGPMAATFRLTS